MQPNPELEGFIKDQESYSDFRDYIEGLLRATIPDKYVKICMTEVMNSTVERKHVMKRFSDIEKNVAGVAADNKDQVGPFSIIRRAFTHSLVNDINLEALETLGDGVLNETVAMIIVTNWPNLLASAGHVANMKSYHSSNAQIAKYAEKLGFYRWIVRVPGQGLNSKERGDIFESFIGALVLIGEFYIGDQMGLAIARLFLNQFFKTVEWHPEDTEFYEPPKSLWNDFTLSLPKDQNVKKMILKSRQIDDIWKVTLIVEDVAETGGPLHKKCGENKLTFRARNRNRDLAETEVFHALRKKINLKRKDIIEQRRIKQSEKEDIFKYVKMLDQFNEKTGRNLFIPGSKKRGKRVFVRIEEEVSAVVGGKRLVYNMTITSAWAENTNIPGEAEIKATQEAYNKLITGKLFKPIPGADLDFYNPDEDVFKKPVSENQDLRKKAEIAPEDSKARTMAGRGDSKPQSRGRGRGNFKIKNLFDN